MNNAHLKAGMNLVRKADGQYRKGQKAVITEVTAGTLTVNIEDLPGCDGGLCSTDIDQWDVVVTWQEVLDYLKSSDKVRFVHKPTFYINPNTYEVQDWFNIDMSPEFKAVEISSVYIDSYDDIVSIVEVNDMTVIYEEALVELRVVEENKKGFFRHSIYNKPVAARVRYGLGDSVLTEYYQNEVFEVVGIRIDELELKGDWSGGTHNVCQKSWYQVDKCILVKRFSVDKNQ